MAQAQGAAGVSATIPGMASEDFSTAFTDPHDPASCEVPGCMHGKWAEQMEMMARFDPVTAALMNVVTGTFPCAGKGFEHHQQVVVPEGTGRWRCPDCGDTGSDADFDAYSKRLLSLLPLLDRLRGQMLDRGAVVLVPTSGATGSLGTFMGHDVIRVPGLAGPMIGIPELRVPGVLADIKAHAESGASDQSG